MIETIIKAKILPEARAAGKTILELVANPQRLEIAKQDGTFIKACETFADAHNLHSDKFEQINEEIFEEGGPLAQGKFRDLCIKANLRTVHFSCDNKPEYEIIKDIGELINAPKRLDTSNEEKLIALAERYCHLRQTGELYELPTSVSQAIKKLRVNGHKMGEKDLINSSRNLVDKMDEEIKARPSLKEKLSDFFIKAHEFKNSLLKSTQPELIKTMKTKAGQMKSPELYGTAIRIKQEDSKKKGFLAWTRRVIF